MNIMLVSRDSAAALNELLTEFENFWVSVNANDLQECKLYWRCYHEYMDMVLIAEEDTNFFDEETREENISTLKKIAKNKEGKRVIYISTKKNNIDMVNKESLPNMQTFYVQDKSKFVETVDKILRHVSIPEEVSKTYTDIINKILKSSNEFSKTIIFTGQDGAGITSTASHMAYHASLIGIKTYIINLDLSENVFQKYFKKIGKAHENSGKTSRDFVNCFINPEKFENYSQKINDNLYLSTFHDSSELKGEDLNKICDKKILENAIYEYRKKAQLIIIDIPFNEYSTINALTNQVDVIALCAANNLYSLNNLTKMLKNIKPELEFFEKSKVVLSKFHMKNTYGGKAFNAELACDILAQMNKELDVKFSPGGVISAIEDFVADVEHKSNPAVKNAELRRRYLETLNELISS